MATVGSAEIARALNLTPQHVARLAREGLPRLERGRYDLGACMHWYIRYLQQALKARASGEGSEQTSLMAQRTRQARARSEAMERANATARGELVALALVQQQELQAFIAAKQALEALPARLNLDETMRETLGAEVHATLNRLADALEAIGGKRPAMARARRKGKVVRACAPATAGH